MNPTRLLSFAMLALLPATPDVCAAVGAEEAVVNAVAGPEVVLCLTKAFVHDASYDTFQRVCSVERQIRGVHIRGVATTNGHAVVEFENCTPPSAAAPAPLALVLKVYGTTLTEAVGHQGKVDVHTLGQTEFTATKRIVFDGDKFTGQPTQVDVRHHTEIGQVSCPGSHFRQRLVARLGRAKMEQVRVVGDTMSRQETLQQVLANVDLEGGHLVALLNDLGPSVHTLAELASQGRPWQLRVKAQDSRMLIACGVGDYSLAPLTAGSDANGSPVEIWIRGTLGPAAIRDILDGCDRVNSRMRENYSQRHDGKTATAEALAAECRNDYLVIAVGASAFGTIPRETKPESLPAKSPKAQWADNRQPTTFDKLTSRGDEPRLLFPNAKSGQGILPLARDR